MRLDVSLLKGTITPCSLDTATIDRVAFFKFQYAYKLPGDLAKKQILIHRSGKGLEISHVQQYLW